jgi:hypothetical protein
MSRRILRPAVLFAIFAAIAVLGVAVAAIPDGDGTIHACYGQSTNPKGLLRVIDPSTGQVCKSGERALNFNQRGPTGAPGPSGERGPTGTKGDRGPSDAYPVRDTGSKFIDNDGAPHPLITEALPGGSYAINGRVVVAGGVSGIQIVQCDIAFTPAPASSGSFQLVDQLTLDNSDTADGDDKALPLQGTLSNVDSGDLSLRCAAFPFAAQLISPTLTAIQVANIR